MTDIDPEELADREDDLVEGGPLAPQGRGEPQAGPPQQEPAESGGLEGEQRDADRADR